MNQIGLSTADRSDPDEAALGLHRHRDGTGIIAMTATGGITGIAIGTTDADLPVAIVVAVDLAPRIDPVDNLS